MYIFNNFSHQNNSKCSVRYIFKATKQGTFESVFEHFLLFHHLHTNIHIYTLHFIHAIHISTRTCHIHHKRGVTEVCHFACFRVSYGRSATSRYLWDGQKEHHNNKKVIWCIGSSIACMACFYKPYDSLTTLGSPIGALVGLL